MKPCQLVKGCAACIVHACTIYARSDPHGGSEGCLVENGNANLQIIRFFYYIFSASLGVSDYRTLQVGVNHHLTGCRGVLTP